jgi:hypothetical protein
VTVSACRKYALISSVGLFLVACSIPALILHVKQQLGAAGFRWQGYQSISGANLLISGLAFGWLRMKFAAFANLPLWASWILFARRRFRASRLWASVTLVMSVETLQLVVQPFIWDEGMTREGYLVAPHIGAIYWSEACFSLRSRVIASRQATRKSLIEAA